MEGNDKELYRWNRRGAREGENGNEDNEINGSAERGRNDDENNNSGQAGISIRAGPLFFYR